MSSRAGAITREFVTSGYFGGVPGDPDGGLTRVVTQNNAGNVTHHDPFTSTPMGVNSISPAHLHVRPMGVNSISPTYLHVRPMGRACR